MDNRSNIAYRAELVGTDGDEAFDYVFRPPLVDVGAGTVAFAKLTVRAKERYWRGPVLHDFDGYTWRRGAHQAIDPPSLRYLGAPFRFSITLVPNGNRWWLTLDTVVGSPDRRATTLSPSPAGGPVAAGLVAVS